MSGDTPFTLGRLGRHTIVYGLGILLSKCVSFLLLPLYTHYLTTADYGDLALVEMTISAFSIFAGSTLVNGVYRFYHKTDDQEERQRVLSTAYVLLGGTFGLAALAAFTAGPAMWGILFHSDRTLLVRLAAANLWLEGLLAVPLAYLRLKDWSATFVATQLSKLTAQILLNILFVAVLRWGPEGVLLGGVLSNLGLVAVVSYLLWKHISWGFDRRQVRRLVRYGAPLIVAHIAAFIVTFLDRYFLQSTSGLSVVGIYALAYQFAFVYAALSYEPFSMVWEPMRFHVGLRPDRDAIIARVFVLFNVLTMSVGLVIVLFVKDVLRLMTTPAYYPAAAFVPILAVACVFQFWANFLNQGMMMRERTEFWTLGNWTAAGVALLGYLTLIPRYHAYGAALATLLAYAARLAVVYPVSQSLWRVNLRWRPVAVLTVLACATYFLAEVIAPLPFAASLALRFGLLMLFLAGVWFLPILDRADREGIRARVSVTRGLVGGWR